MWPIYLLEALAVLAAWTVVPYAIWKWGPGLRKRAVKCPITKRRAVTSLVPAMPGYDNSRRRAGLSLTMM